MISIDQRGFSVLQLLIWVAIVGGLVYGWFLIREKVEQNMTEAAKKEKIGYAPIDRSVISKIRVELAGISPMDRSP